ncbi:MAG: ADP-ribosylation factor-like protein [Candidatus Helarchaeota archaeon]
MSEIYKIVFIGLDFAGKTSILKLLEGSYRGFDKIKPTLGPKRTSYQILGFDIMNWDLGGQKQYREEYLKNYEQILHGTNLLIFVLDIQDPDRFNEAGAYYNEILNALNRMTIKCPIILCLHKLDPDISTDQQFKKNLESATDLFSGYSQKYDVEIKVFTTSIFDRKSLIEMFSYGIQRLIPIGLFSTILEEFRKDAGSLGLVGVVLFDENFFVVGNAFPNPTTKNTCFKTINAFITLLRDFKGVYDEGRNINFDLPISNGDLFKFQLHKLTNLSNKYYLLLMGTQSLLYDDVISLFQQTYSPKMEKGLQELVLKRM